MNRRTFLLLPGLSLLGPLLSEKFDLVRVERTRVLTAAQSYLSAMPVTVTASHSPRSADGLHDFFSEGDYWWPDPKDPGAPYIQRDGMTNPENFVAHRQALMRLSIQVPALVAAWTITRDSRFSKHAVRHLAAWFTDPSTMMNPNLQFAQAIKGRATGRGIGIIDTIHLVEVAKAASILERSPDFTPVQQKGVRQWFESYLKWMTTHQYGLDEREAKNNHGTCWVMQVAEFSKYTGNRELTSFCAERYKTVLLPNQVAADGSFPLELRRTKPYSYSLFNLEAMSSICQTLSTPADNLWTYTLSDGRGIGKALEFMYPYIADKSRWPYPKDVMYFDQWPVRQSSLLFGSQALNRPAYLDLWKKLDPDPKVEEVIRNFPIRQPLLWQLNNLPIR